MMAIGDVIESVFPPTGREEQQRKDNEARMKCEAQGGEWDAVNRRCIINKPKPKEAKPEEKQPIKLSDEQKKKGGFVTDAQGNEFFQTPEQLQADKNEIERINAAKGGTGAAELIQVQREKQRIQQRNAQLVELAKQGLLTQDELNAIGGSDINFTEALGAGAIQGALYGGSAGLTIGAASGLGVATPVTAPIGAAVGTLFGFINGVKNSIKAQQAGEFAADQTALTKGERYLRSLITDTNQNPQNTAENIAMFYQTLNLIDAAHAKTWKDSQENLNQFLGNDGTPQLAKFNTFDSTMRNYYIAQFDAAILNPDPNKVLITADDLSEGLE